MKYRLETSHANSPDPRIVEDDNHGVSYHAAQIQLMRHYLLTAQDALGRAERVANEISDQVLRWETD